MGPEGEKVEALRTRLEGAGNLRGDAEGIEGADVDELIV
jgi:hypothetical protein